MVVCKSNRRRATRAGPSYSPCYSSKQYMRLLMSFTIHSKPSSRPAPVCALQHTMRQLRFAIELRPSACVCA